MSAFKASDVSIAAPGRSAVAAHRSFQ